MRGLYKYLILFVFSLYMAPIAEASVATIEAIGGADKVLIKRDGKRVFLTQGADLALGDEVVSDKGTAVDIRMEDGAVIRVGINSTYRLEEDSKSSKLLHKLLSGVVRVLVPKSNSKVKNIKFKMSTPEGTIGVRGTEFVVLREAGETKVKGLSGEVLFGPESADFANESVFVSITKGLESKVAKGDKKPQDPKEFSVPEYLREIDGKYGGSFAPLSMRGKSQKIARTEKVLPKRPTISSSQKVKSQVVAMRAPKVIEAPKNKQDPDSILLQAVVSGEVGKVDTALSKGASANAVFGTESDPILTVATHSSGKDKLLVMQLLVDKGAKVNQKNRQGETALISLAIEGGDKKVAEVLVENKADILIKDSRGKTALGYALDNKHDELAEYLGKHLDDKE